ncbi:MAG: Crp/Fnr family transcriptional regulator [endosymbiont of Galathealinum brachiosum]|uniref:Crp/Fnr family transcriptional regulator n=1 Tax=endosymbiont of Galathealinum brachiosum TaxID=2200906 RepID=A0A370DCJ3_9GAMM|nr:MAG: Crp/Fnr family transcriptional regulator [endosymbiont of Galathealinum brachiosum]
MDTDLFDNIQLFSALSSEQLHSLGKHFTVRRHPKNTILINEGDETNSLYIILEGRVKVYLNDDAGKEVVLNTQSKGEYFGEVSLFDDGPRSASVLALEDCQFAVLLKKDLIKAITDNPEISLAIIRGLTQRCRALSENVRSLALMDVYGRVARTLMEMAVEQENGIWLIDQPVTYNDLASRVGASSKMVSRIMQDLKKGGYIRKQAKQMIIERSLPAAW